MPKVPEYNNKPLKTVHSPQHPTAPASLKQKNFILTLCERRKIVAPNMENLTSGQAAQFISNLINR